MKIKISSRDIKFFLLGVFTFFIISIIYDWDNFVDGFKRGMNDSKNDHQIENTK